MTVSREIIQNFIAKHGRPSEENIAKEFETNAILENLPSMPPPLKTMYKIIGNPRIEYYFGEWVLTSLVTVQKRLDVMLREGNSHVVDFALRYAGMGHIVVCSYDPDDGKIFFRRDGGSNGYERVDRWNFIRTYSPKDNEKYDINVWFDKIENENDKEQPWVCLQDPLLINHTVSL